MAPTDVFHRLKDAYFGRREENKPMISTKLAVLLSVAFTLLYVLPFYTSKATRPSPTLNRDAPSVIRARIRAVTLACVASSLATFYLITTKAGLSLTATVSSLGYWPIQPVEILRCCILTCLLYLGPLFEQIFVHKALADLRNGQLIETLSSWQGYRNYVAGPITEEVLFRSVLVPLHLLAMVSPSNMVFLTPLYFGIAHVHHFYEFTLTHPHTPLIPAVLRTLFQFTYTTLFGWYATFLFLRTRSLLLCVIVHTFCNAMGLPRFWGRLKRQDEQYPLTPAPVRAKDDEDSIQGRSRKGDLGLQWTVAYYVLLVLGTYSFYAQLWPLTVSDQPLVKFASDPFQKQIAAFNA